MTSRAGLRCHCGCRTHRGPAFSWRDPGAVGHLKARLVSSFVVFIPIPMPLFKLHPCLDRPSLVILPDSTPVPPPTGSLPDPPQYTPTASICGQISALRPCDQQVSISLLASRLLRGGAVSGLVTFGPPVPMEGAVPCSLALSSLRRHTGPDTWQGHPMGGAFGRSQP